MKTKIVSSVPKYIPHIYTNYIYLLYNEIFIKI